MRGSSHKARREVGIAVDDDGIKMKVNTDASLGSRASGELQVELATDQGFEFVGSVGDKDLAVKVAANEGLEFAKRRGPPAPASAGSPPEVHAGAAP